MDGLEPLPDWEIELFREQQIRKTTSEWLTETGIVILDPDGWRGAKALGFDVPVTYGDFLARVTGSAVNHHGTCHES